MVVKPCGFSLERTLRERDVIERDVLAVVGPATRTYVTDGNAFFNRPGPRLVESLEIMAACVHPELFSDFAATHASVIARMPALRGLVGVRPPPGSGRTGTKAPDDTLSAQTA